jgi:hypothetical protein
MGWTWETCGSHLVKACFRAEICSVSNVAAFCSPNSSAEFRHETKILTSCSISTRPMKLCTYQGKMSPISYANRCPLLLRFLGKVLKTGLI